MKRNNTKYTNAVGGDIYKHYGLLFWQECFFCNKEFRREAGYRFQMQVNRAWVYSCGDCCSSLEDINTKVKEWFVRSRPKAPIAHPKPNNLTLEQAFDIIFDKYEDALQELSEK